MSRSIWKGLVFDINVKKTRMYNRFQCIPEYLLDKTVGVYSGCDFKKLYVRRNHLGFKFGDFCFTRKSSKSVVKTKRKSKK